MTQISGNGLLVCKLIWLLTITAYYGDYHSITIIYLSSYCPPCGILGNVVYPEFSFLQSLVNELIEAVDKVMGHMVNNLEVQSEAPVTIRGKSHVAGQCHGSSNSSVFDF